MRREFFASGQKVELLLGERVDVLDIAVVAAAFVQLVETGQSQAEFMHDETLGLACVAHPVGQCGRLLHRTVRATWGGRGNQTAAEMPIDEDVGLAIEQIAGHLFL